MTDKEKKEIQTHLNKKIFANQVIGKKYFEKGLLRRHLIVEAGSKFSNKLNWISGEESGKKLRNLPKAINMLKYKLVEHGEYSLVQDHKNKDMLHACQVIKWDDFGTGELYYLYVRFKEYTINGEKFIVEKEYQLDPRTPDLKTFVVKTTAYNVGEGQYMSIDKLNKLLGRNFYTLWEVVDTPYIPAAVFQNSFDAESDIEGLEEVFLLERQLLKEIPRDLDLSRKKVLYKTRLARKGKTELEIEMNNESIVVFEDGNAVYTSPIDLWSPALAIETITRTIDWLTNYVLKMKFAAKDSMATGAQKTDEQVSEINQSAQNYLEDKKELLSWTMTDFLRMILGDEEIEVEFQLMTTVDRLINGVEPVPGKTNLPVEVE